MCSAGSVEAGCGVRWPGNEGYSIGKHIHRIALAAELCWWRRRRREA